MKGQKQRKKSLHKSIIHSAVIPSVVLLIFIGIICSYYVYQNNDTMVQKEEYSNVRVQANKLEAHLSKYVMIVRYMQYNSDIRNFCAGYQQNEEFEEERYARNVERLLNEVLDSANTSDVNPTTWIADVDAKKIVMSDGKEITVLGEEDGFFLKDRAWYSQAMQANETVISKPYRTILNNDWVVSILCPVHVGDSPSSELLGIMGINIPVDSLPLLATSGNSTRYSVVLDAEGNILYHPNDKIIGTVNNAYEIISESYKRGSSDRVSKFKMDGNEYYAFVNDIPSTNWVVMSIVPKDTMIREKMVSIAPMALLVVAAIILMLSWIYISTQVIMKPVRRMALATKRIAEGDITDVLATAGTEEIENDGIDKQEIEEIFSNTIDKLRYKVQYDSLTGLYNKETAYIKVAEMIQDDFERRYAMIRIDFKHFKFFNGVYGNIEGDKLLKHMADVIRQETPDQYCVYGRLSGDIFAICVSYEEEEELISLTKSITKRIEAYPLQTAIRVIYGIYLIQERSMPVSEIMDYTNIALKSIKENQFANYAFFDLDLQMKMISDRKIEIEMQKALDNREFTFFVQPKYDMKSGKIVGGESLVRWIHPEEGLISPNKFVPLFEENGFIIKLDEYIWEETCIMLRSWMDMGYEMVPISVNVSRVHLLDPTFCSKIKELVNKYNIPPKYFELELTESALFDDIETIYSTMNELKEAGFVILMDDFGSGYSSLNMLKNVPVDTVKIDREFLNETVNSNKGKTVIRNVISMINELDLEIVAEGVETKEQVDFLLASGCKVAQGYYYSKPVQINNFEEETFCK